MTQSKRMDNFIKSVLSNIKSKDMTSLKELLNTSNEVDVLEMFQELSVEDQAVAYRML